jgi:FkbM family methyltransferase
MLRRMKTAASSLAYNAILRTRPLADVPGIRALWKSARRLCVYSLSQKVYTRLHGRVALIPSDHAYPLIARQHPNYNAPLIELVSQSHRVYGHPVTLVDVGANIGDTVFLLLANCPGAVSEFLCIEGDAEYYDFLCANVSALTNVRLYKTMLSSDEVMTRSLVRHNGTASAVGDLEVETTTLDKLLMGMHGNSAAKSVGVLKIDVDGFDGRVLAGAFNSLVRFKPGVVFEWHPVLCHNVGNSDTQHFEVLSSAGYDRFIWFNKYGEFSHFMNGFRSVDVESLSNLCRCTRVYPDWHYDVVALHSESRLSEYDIADACFARDRSSRF